MQYNLKESGERIQKLRKQHGLTQEQLAESVCISPDNLGRLERGQQGLSIDLLIELASFFSVTLDYIIRQLVDTVKVISADEIIVYLRGGVEIRQDIIR